MLKVKIPKFYIVKEGQSVKRVAEAFGITERLLADENALAGELRAGEIVRVPQVRGNLYTIREGDGKTLLSGSAENFEKKNRTSLFYPGMRVLL